MLRFMGRKELGTTERLNRTDVEEAQRYVNEEILCRPYTVSFVPSYHTGVVHVLLAVYLKQAVTQQE